jgi:hypothetical protein
MNNTDEQLFESCKEADRLKSENARLKYEIAALRTINAALEHDNYNAEMNLTCLTERLEAMTKAYDINAEVHLQLTKDYCALKKQLASEKTQKTIERCPYINTCPSATGWCNNADFERCMPFVQRAISNLQRQINDGKKMIFVEGYRAFRGIMLITPKNGVPPFELDGDWLYKPEYNCWYGCGRSFVADICEAKEETT